MSYLLDVNVLIALVDSRHVNHDAAHAWFAGISRWATCPLTENAFVRILSSPAYPTVDAIPATVVDTLRQLIEHPGHVAISDDVSLSDERLFDSSQIVSARQVTDVYLLGLAVRHGLALATFDRRLRAAAVKGADHASVVQIPA